MNYSNQTLIKWLMPLSAVLLLASCGDDDDDNNGDPPPVAMETRQFSISLINATNAQPLSPVLAVLHQEGYLAWEVGSAASEGLEVLAEDGDNSELINEASAAEAYLSHESTADPVGPGSSTTLDLSLSFAEGDEPDMQLTLASMLVNTNDAYVGVTGYELDDLAVGESRTIRPMTWDAGTEANSEAAGTIPGPVDSGVGFDANRDDSLDVVSIHRGVVTQDDGLSSSVLTEAHRFDNPTMLIHITRQQ